MKVVAHSMTIQIVMVGDIGDPVTRYYCSSDCYAKARDEIYYGPNHSNLLITQRPNKTQTTWDSTISCAHCNRAMPYGSSDAERVDDSY